MIKNKFKIRTKQKNKSIKRKSRYWILSVTAVGLLIAYTVGESRAVAVAHVLDDRIVAARSAGGKDSLPRRFRIPAGSLADVLAAFEKESGWRVTIPDNIKDIASGGVSGDYTEEQALKQILADTGVVYTILSPNNIALKLQGPAETVEVANENSALSSPKYTEPLRDIPQTITVIDKKTIEQQGATTLRDVLRNVPGLTVTAGEGGNVGGDNLTLRGFSARNDIYVDGARDLSPQNRDPFNLEQVEVVKGPSSATTGRGSTGGTVNLVTKVPNLRPSYNFDLSGGTDRTKRITGDLNVPLERLKLGSESAFRINFVGHDSTYAGREDVRNSRYGVAPTLLIGLSKKTTLTLGYFFLGQKNIQDYGIPFVPPTNNVLVDYRDRPAPVPRGTFYGYLDLNKEYLRSNLGTVTLNHVFNDNMSLRNQFRYDHSSRDSIATPARFNNDNSGTLMNREIKAWLTTDQTYDNQTDFTARFKTGFIEHSVVTGVELLHENSRRFTRSAANGSTNLYNPNPNDIYPGVIYTNPLPGIVKADTEAFYAFDTLKLHPKFELTGGLRYERYKTDGDLPPTITLPTATVPVIFGTTRAHVSKTDNLFNVRLAAIYKPFQIGSFYASYGTSSNPSLSGLIYENATVTSLDPEKTRTLEAGTKWDLFEGRLLATAAIFRVEKTNARTPQPDGTLQILDGRQRVDGIELGITGNVTKNWSILTGYTLLASRIVESNAFTIVSGVRIFEVGNRFINTPRNSFNLWSTYRLPFNINIGGGTRFVDRRYANTINTRFVESYWLIEATASYQVTKHIEVRLNGYNLGNTYYFDRISGGHAVPGPGRSLLVSTGFRF
jgi:catecholate siderophore receptor